MSAAATCRDTPEQLDRLATTWRRLLDNPYAIQFSDLWRRNPGLLEETKSGLEKRGESSRLVHGLISYRCHRLEGRRVTTGGPLRSWRGRQIGNDD